MNRKLLICALAALASLAFAGAGCGGDDEETTVTPTTTTTTSTGATGATGATGESGVSGTATSEDVLACLQDANLDATTNEDRFLGLEADYERIDVGDGAELDQAAVIAIFSDEQTASDELSTAEVALGVNDVKQAGNVVWGIDAVADFTPSDEEAIEGCLPS
jgi:hypothetical protein